MILHIHKMKDGELDRTTIRGLVPEKLNPEKVRSEAHRTEGQAVLHLLLGLRLTSQTHQSPSDR